MLDLGAGTGRVALDLAGHGFVVTALDRDVELLAALTARAAAAGVEVETVLADAGAFDLGEERFALVLAPMQTAQLLGGRDRRAAMLHCVRRALRAGGLLACALANALEGYDATTLDPGAEPVADEAVVGGARYVSRPTAIRDGPEAFVLERRRERTGVDGTVSVTEDRIVLDRVSAARLGIEARAAGFAVEHPLTIAATDDHVGSEVAMLRAA